MQYIVYNLIIGLAAPVGKTWLALTGRHAALSRRFMPDVPAGTSGAIWIHACSVGEINTVRPLLPKLKECFPGTPIMLTTSTEAGFDLAGKALADAAIVTWLPFDTPMAVRRFLNSVKPRVLILVETEIWPNLVRETRRNGIPVAVINGRLSPRRYPRYKRFRWFLRPVFNKLSAVGAQNEEYADRFVEMGVEPGAVRVTGNLKFDAVRTEVDSRSKTDLRVACGYGPDTPLLVFGSTRPGDEELAAVCWQALRGKFPSLHLIIAPRHPKRLAEALKPFEAEKVVLRSEQGAGAVPHDARVLFVDTLGELAKFYSLASVAVIGGSFFPGVDGHNPLESAALGVATVYGPYMGNFPEAAEALSHWKGGIQVSSPELLAGELERLLSDSHACRALGTLGRRAVLENQGAVLRNADLVAELLAAAEASK